jgi:hypothetical protein
MKIMSEADPMFLKVKLTNYSLENYLDQYDTEIPAPTTRYPAAPVDLLAVASLPPAEFASIKAFPTTSETITGSISVNLHL